MPCYKNAYQPPPPPTYSSDIHLTTPAEVYDLNFCFNQPAIDNLKGDGRQVELEPLIPSQHAQLLFDNLRPAHFAHLPTPQWSSLQQCLQLIEQYGRSDPGWVMIFKDVQRTHVLTHAVSLMLDHAFRLPADGGWGVRRVQWQANDTNAPSIAAARRLGFVDEAPISLRAVRALRADQKGSYLGRAGDPLELQGRIVGRSSALLSITAQEWETGTRTLVDDLVHKYAW